MNSPYIYVLDFENKKILVAEELFQFEEFKHSRSNQPMWETLQLSTKMKNKKVKNKSSLREENVWDSKIKSIKIYLGKTLVITLKD
jgi:hypothetical protein